MRHLAWPLAAALAVSGAGCRKGPEACVVTGVTVEEAPGPSPMKALGLDREEIRRIGVEALAATPGLSVPASPPAQGARLCRASVSLLDARMVVGGPAPVAAALVRVDVSPGEDADPVGSTESAREEVGPGEARIAAFRRAIRSAAARAASGAALALAESRKPDEAVIRDLESGDPQVRDLAVGVLADRKNRAAVPGLIARLQDPDPGVADRAVGALAQMGDPRAVGPIIALARRREGPFVAQMVRAIGDIGGAEAEAYLETMAAGHPDPEVAEAAREALRDARRRRARGQ